MCRRSQWDVSKHIKKKSTDQNPSVKKRKKKYSMIENVFRRNGGLRGFDKNELSSREFLERNLLRLWVDRSRFCRQSTEIRITVTVADSMVFGRGRREQVVFISGLTFDKYSFVVKLMQNQKKKNHTNK